ncbi:IclR family transcriptional regulator [Pseudomonas typographi]|uniref:IclR family transcriptional regulator n=1 Tax=Pseudomonas typographi TaxID=2715964 RepID=A0ABR7Z4N8_9PSED|nr:IclR family transcriptional regulator [Pseudomonas typographi]MBD1588347.1 IclR family transcriptional regulator [Pseudomonas typographi]MBD1600318.1 IclR family transcriptional regulator [Pseudomonas typographi]
MNRTSLERTDSQRPSRGADDGCRTVITRAARVLRTLEQAPNGLTIAQITRASALPRTTVQRLVGSLQAEELVAVRDGRVRLGPALARLAAAAHQDVRERLRPHLEALCRDTGETVDVWVLRDNEAVLVDQVVAQQEVRIVVPLGSRYPLHCTAPGKVFLAEWANADIVALAERPLTGPTPHSITSLQALLADIQGIRRSGIAYDWEEHAEDVCALACAVELGSGQRHAIAIPAPARRFRQHQAAFEAALRQCVAALGGE